MRTEQARPVRLKDYLPPEWQVDAVRLDISLHPTATRVRAELHVRPNRDTAPSPLVLDGDGLLLEAISVDGAPLAADGYAATPDRLTIAQPPQRPFTLTLETVVDPSANTQLMGLYRSSNTYCTQCEAEGFRRITYFPDRPDVMAVYTTRIEADKAQAPVLLANGNLIESGDLPGGRHFAVWHDPFPKPSYLFAMVGGTLACVEDTFVTMSGRKVTLRIYVEPGKEDRCGYAMDALKRSMRWDEEAFGREYDLDIFMIVAVSDFNMGAMENKGLNVFNDRYVLASPETAVDGDFAAIEAIIAHEYFHNWTGNRITCRDWFQLCLKEGLTVYRDQEFSADMRSRAVERIGDVRNLRAHQFVEDAGPLAHPVRPETYHEINNFYTTTVYEKGAEVVRMLRVLLGAQAFRKGMDLYFERHDGEAATVEQFVQCFADASGRDLSQFMRWYSQAGTPDVVANGQHDAAAQTYTLTLTQSLAPTPGQSVKAPMVIPLKLGLVGADGADIPLRSGGKPAPDVVVLTEPVQTVVYENVTQRPALSINRAFSAPVKLTANLSAEDLQRLAAHDSDSFNRWQAIQTLATRLLVGNVALIRDGKAAAADDGLTTALAVILSDARLEPAFVALALAMPTEADIAREIGRDVDPDANFAARTHLRKMIGTALHDTLAATYERLTSKEPYSPDAASAGCRALRNAALDLLAATGEASAIARAMTQYRNADNMTDRMAALATLSLHDRPERNEALEDFHARYAGDPLIIDKWLGLQAMIPEPGTLERVRTLMSHRAFAMSNPNRVRALIGSFAHANATQFNRPDGAGYDFVADAVLALDAKNPQVAARLATAFRSWRALESGRRAKAEAALQRIAAASTLSADVSDIANRALAPS
ncbi:aminopeptidase N [Pseudorhodoplanes sp.]|uniref:aminopeptidase N n=1 Tax=Pseudorhodoplanes sp. TaxID=1934341 RepID=UPI00391BD6F9